MNGFVWSTVTLGPGTGDLRLRVGIHSGPVTAGVLRGERSRFQLFGVRLSHQTLALFWHYKVSITHVPQFETCRIP